VQVGDKTRRSFDAWRGIILCDMGNKSRAGGAEKAAGPTAAPAPGRPSALLDTRVIYCGDCLEQLRKLPPACVDLVYIDPPFNSNRNYEVFWGETKEKRSFRGPPRLHTGVHRLHALAVRGTCPRAEEDRQLLVPLRLGRHHGNDRRTLRTN